MNSSTALRRLTGEAAATRASLGLLHVLGFLLAHALLAWLMAQSATVATLHALATLAVGGALVFVGQQKQAAYAAAYIAGAEVLWRMTGANIFWEFGKYATVAILVLALLRSRSTQIPRLVLLYFVFLLPSVILTATGLPLSEARDQISFNLSGPLSLFVSVWFFSALELRAHEFERIVLAFIAPAVGIATLALSSIISASSIQWTSASNFVASGGFGPNQVSSALALGALLIFLLLIAGRTNARIQTVLGLVAVWLLGQTALTFSRGGFVTTSVAAIAALLHALFTGRRRGKALLLAAASIVLVAFVLFPYLDDFTGGALRARYADTGLTGREALMQEDLEVFLSHPLTGVGPGMAKAYHETNAAAHTEFTRMLAEHGLMGAFAMLLLVALAARAYWVPDRSMLARTVVASLVLWAFLYMFHSSMRLVSVSFAFGLAFAAFPDFRDDAEATLGDESSTGQLA